MGDDGLDKSEDLGWCTRPRVVFYASIGRTKLGRGILLTHTDQLSGSVPPVLVPIWYLPSHPQQ